MPSESIWIPDFPSWDPNASFRWLLEMRWLGRRIRSSDGRRKWPMPWKYLTSTWTNLTRIPTSNLTRNFPPSKSASVKHPTCPVSQDYQQQNVTKLSMMSFRLSNDFRQEFPDFKSDLQKLTKFKISAIDLRSRKRLQDQDQPWRPYGNLPQESSRRRPKDFG